MGFPNNLCRNMLLEDHNSPTTHKYMCRKYLTILWHFKQYFTWRSKFVDYLLIFMRSWYSVGFPNIFYLSDWWYYLWCHDLRRKLKTTMSWQESPLKVLPQIAFHRRTDVGPTSAHPSVRRWLPTLGQRLFDRRANVGPTSASHRWKLYTMYSISQSDDVHW